MTRDTSLDPALVEAVRKIEDFVLQATGTRPDPPDLANAMTKYFVLKEILEFVQLEWEKD